MIKAIIFDFDGVIVESVDIKTKSFERLFEHYGEKITKRVIDYHLQHTGISRFTKFKYIYKNILNQKLLNKTFKDLCNKFSKLVVEEVVNAPYVLGAKQFLDRYIRKYKFFISSATPQNEIKNIILRRKIKNYFKKIYGSPNLKVNIVRKILSSDNFLPKECVYIGDSLSDYKAAKTHAVNFIARINQNEQIFKNINCVKIKNLINLNKVLKKF